MDHAHLKARHRAERAGHDETLSVRLHRALSWLNRAEQLADDPDSQFVFLWIAFNAAYATDIDDSVRLAEQSLFRSFLRRLDALDRGRQRIERLVWEEFAQSIRALLDNPYVSPDFWKWHNGEIDETEWKLRFATDRRRANRALAREATLQVLGIALSRVYTLRNQLLHGGATWNGKVNRHQVRDCTRMMARLVPLVIEIMLDHPQAKWPKPSYPVIVGT
jgi:hypothetical protein